MRRAVLLPAAAVLLVGPTVLAFFSGGYFDEPRLIATLVAWALVLVAALASPRPLPSSRQGWAAFLGLLLIAAWTGVSITWAPLSEASTNSFVRLLMYVAALVAGVALLRDRRSLAAVEPALALGALVAIGYGLSGRLLPGLIHLSQSAKAYGRLEQPITYWNAEGALAAIGLVLCTRLAGTESRPVHLRAAAAAASVPLALGVYLSYSRGAIAAALIGAIVLLGCAPSWSQVRATAISVAAAVVVAASSTAFPGVTALEGSLGRRETEGAIMLAVLLAVMVIAGFTQARIARREREPWVSTGPLPIARRLPLIATVAVALGLAGLVAAGLADKGGKEKLSGAPGVARLRSVESRRYDYWRIALRAFRRHPLKGVGAGGFRVLWLRERPVREAALEVHSLPLEMATELGLPGLLGLGLLVGGVGVAARPALRRQPALVAGACAGATVWFLHAAIDWDWQIPAVSLPPLILAGALIVAGEEELEPEAHARRAHRAESQAAVESPHVV